MSQRAKPPHKRLSSLGTGSIWYVFFVLQRNEWPEICVKKKQGLFFKTILLQNTLHKRQTNECKLSQWKKLKNTCGFAWAAFRALTQVATHRWCEQVGTGTKKASMHTGKEQVWPVHSHQPTISARKSLPEYYDCAALACAACVAARVPAERWRWWWRLEIWADRLPLAGSVQSKSHSHSDWAARNQTLSKLL